MMIRKMKESDISVLNQLHEELFHQSFNFVDYAAEKMFHYGIVLEDKGEILGYLVGQLVFEMGDLFYIAVNPTKRGNGYGLKLMDKFISDAKCLLAETISLEVRVSNQPAISLYEKCGFLRASVRKNYYSDGEDALLMVYYFNT